MGTSNKTKWALNFLGWRSWHPWVCWWWCIGVSTWYLGMPIWGDGSMAVVKKLVTWNHVKCTVFHGRFSNQLRVTMLRIWICFAFCCNCQTWTMLWCVCCSFFKVALSISPWMVSTRVQKEGPPRGAIWFSPKNSKGISFAVWFLYSLELDGLYWGKPCTLAALSDGFRIWKNISFSGLAVIWNFKSLRKNFPEDTLPSTALQLAMTALGCTGTLSWRSMMIGGTIQFLRRKQHFSTQWCTVQILILLIPNSFLMGITWNFHFGSYHISTSLEAVAVWGWTLLSTFSSSGMEGVSGLLWQLPDILSAPGLMPSLLFSALIGNVGSLDGKHWNMVYWSHWLEGDKSI